MASRMTREHEANVLHSQNMPVDRDRLSALAHAADQAGCARAKPPGGARLLGGCAAFVPGTSYASSAQSR